MSAPSPTGSHAPCPRAPGEQVVAAHRWPGRLLLVFCCWHSSFLIFSILPRGPGQELPGNPVLEWYRALTGSRQCWTMFHTIPVLHALDAHMEAVKPDDSRVSSPCMIPGFTSFPARGTARSKTFLERLLASPLGEPFRSAYVRKVNHLQNAGLPEAERLEWKLVFEGEAIRTLFYSRRDGRFSLPFTKVFPPEAPLEKLP